jgi:hypothetical protein
MTRDEILALRGRDLWSTTALTLFNDSLWFGIAVANKAFVGDSVEREVGRRGLQLKYVHALARVVGCNMVREKWTMEDIWMIRRANPEQICKAALLALTP